MTLPSPAAQERLLGVTVLADFILSEGVEAVLDHVAGRAGATAVATNPTVTAPGDETNGSWQPPSDAGASVRRFDRPLWGREALWVRSAPSFRPDEALYRDSPYSPRRANELTEAHGPVIDDFIRAAHARGLKVYFQVGAVQPPGLRAEDTPRLPDGSIPARRMAATGSLASEAIRAYNRAYARDLLARYPTIDGLRVDWPEYPCYTLGEAFQDFGEPVARWAAARDFPFEEIHSRVGHLYDRLHGELTNDDLERALRLMRPQAAHSLPSLAFRLPSVPAWLELKAALSGDLLRDWREALDAAGGVEKELSANAFPPPFNALTGLRYAGAAQHCGSVSVKLYTMHWALMVRFWGDELLAHNPGLDEQLLAAFLVTLFDIGDREVPAGLAAYDYPEPEAPHPVPDAAQQRKLAHVIERVGGAVPVYALVHGYGPLADFRRRLKVAVESGVDGVWINRYGYLSDAKLDAVHETWRRDR